MNEQSNHVPSCGEKIHIEHENGDQAVWSVDAFGEHGAWLQVSRVSGTSGLIVKYLRRISKIGRFTYTYGMNGDERVEVTFPQEEMISKSRNLDYLLAYMRREYAKPVLADTHDEIRTTRLTLARALFYSAAGKTAEELPDEFDHFLATIHSEHVG